MLSHEETNLEIMEEERLPRPSVNIKNLPRYLWQHFPSVLSEGCRDHPTEKTQFPAHLYNNQQCNLTHRCRLTDSVSQDSPQKQP